MYSIQSLDNKSTTSVMLQDVRGLFMVSWNMFISYDYNDMSPRGMPRDQATISGPITRSNLPLKFLTVVTSRKDISRIRLVLYGTNTGMVAIGPNRIYRTKNVLLLLSVTRVIRLIPNIIAFGRACTVMFVLSGKKRQLRYVNMNCCIDIGVRRLKPKMITLSDSASFVALFMNFKIVMMQVAYGQATGVQK